MRRLLFAIALASLVLAQIPQDRTELAPILSFESQQQTGSVPKGWTGGPSGTVFADSETVHSGKWSARVERTLGSDEKFSALTNAIRTIDFGGDKLELRGYLKTANVDGAAGLWLREDGTQGTIAFDNMVDRAVIGNTEWTQYSIALPLRKDAKSIYFGALLSGIGTMWVDDLELLVDGTPIWKVAKTPEAQTALDKDHQFDQGSGIALAELSPVQINNLVTLGKVWGFLKYHHSVATSGKVHWDYELFRQLPAILRATDRSAGNAALAGWIKSLGAIEACSKCAKLDERELKQRPHIDWISDESRLGPELSQALRSIYANRPGHGQQFYVAKAQNGNPEFDHELPYQSIHYPDAGFQLLGAYRLWNIVEYWFPDRDVIGEDWDKVLAASIPKLALAKTSEAYQLEMMALIAHIHDTHANLWSSLKLRPPVGDCEVPAKMRSIEDHFVVTQSEQPLLKAGDIVASVDGAPVSKLVESWLPYYAASNRPTQLRDIGFSLLHGACGDVALEITRGAESLKLTMKRVPIDRKTAIARAATNDRPGPTFQQLPHSIAYVKLSSIKQTDQSQFLESIAGAKGLIVDIRNYPSNFVVFWMGGHFIKDKTAFVKFTALDLVNPGAFHFLPSPTLEPIKPHFSGKVIVLVDEVTVSQAEYTTMAFRAAGAKVFGSTTAGADGDVSRIPLPGGFYSMISGLGVFYPNEKPTQRVGIVPDREVRPTIAGIREGRDEVLEAAVAEIQGMKHE